MGMVVSAGSKIIVHRGPRVNYKVVYIRRSQISKLPIETRCALHTQDILRYVSSAST